MQVLDLKEEGLVLDVAVEVLGKFKQYGGVRMKDRPRDASLAHFNGPLRMGPNEGKAGVLDRLALGNPPRELFVLVGTIDRAAGGWVVVQNRVWEQRPDFPVDLHPVAEVVFPPRRHGGKPVTARYVLTRRC